MDSSISAEARRELLEALRTRYRDCGKTEKTRILDEFVAVSGYHRKSAIRLLSCMSVGKESSTTVGPPETGRRIYDEAVREAVTVLWEAADRICGKRLKAVIPSLLEAMEKHGHLDLAPGVRERVLAASAATIDRLLKPVRGLAGSRRKRRRASNLSKKVRVRTFADWHDPIPGYLEIDFVVHCGGSITGAFVHTLAVTDVSSGWTDFVPLLAREQSLVVEGLEVLDQYLPFPILGIDSDNDSAFINDTLFDFCEARGIEFTRSRARRSNDQAWIEQKNGAVVRRLVGHARLSGVVAGQALAHLYHAARLYVNYFQPSFKLREKVRTGAKAKRVYHPPATPCTRVLQHPAVDDAVKKEIRLRLRDLDPLRLLHRIRESQAALAALASPEAYPDGPGRIKLDQFLAQLPVLWKSGEVRPTHRATPKGPRTYRTRPDPFAGVWADVLSWLQETPALPHRFCYRSLVVASTGCYRMLAEPNAAANLSVSGRKPNCRLVRLSSSTERFSLTPTLTIW